MASLIVRNLDEALKTRLRVRAAYHGRSMEEEVRRILRAALAEDPMDLPVPELDTPPMRVRSRPAPATQTYLDDRHYAEDDVDVYADAVPARGVPAEPAAFSGAEAPAPEAAHPETPAPETPSILNSPHLTLPRRTPSAEAVSEGLRRRLTSLLTAYEGMVAREQSGR